MESIPRCRYFIDAEDPEHRHLVPVCWPVVLSDNIDDCMCPKFLTVQAEKRALGLIEEAMRLAPRDKDMKREWCDMVGDEIRRRGRSRKGNGI